MRSLKNGWLVGFSGGKGSSAIVRAIAAALWLAMALLASIDAPAQTPPDLEQGLKPFGSYHGGALDTVSLTNGNLFFQADLFTYSQRGGELTYPIVLRYNNKVFSLFSQPCPPATPACVPTETLLFGPNPLRTQKKSNGNSVTVGYEGLPVVGAPHLDTSVAFDGTEIFVNPLSVVMPDGSTHQLVTTNSGLSTIDGSGYASPASGGLIGRDGTNYSGPGNNFAQDRNGNFLSFDGTTWTDTLGRQIPAAPTVPLPPATPNPSTANSSSCPALNYPFQAVSYAYTWNLPTVNGGTLPLIVCYTNVWVRTGQASGPHFFDVNQAFPMLQSVVFPDNTYWAFQYDAADPNTPSTIGLGDLLKVTLPTGGSITYTWQNWSGCVSQLTPPGGSFSRAVQTRSLDAADGNGPQTWQYSYSLQLTATSLTGQTVVNDAAKNDTVHTITGLGGTCSLYETQTQYFQGLQSAGQLLKTVTTDYQYTVNPYDSVAIGNNGADSAADSVANVFPIRVTTTLPNGQVTKVETDYDNAVAYHGPVDGITWNVNECPSSGGGGSGHTITNPPSDNPPTGGGCWGDQQTNPVTNYTGSYGKVVAKREYDWGQGAPGQLLRQTLTNYQWQVNSAYLTANMLDLTAQIQVKDGNGNQVALTTFGYDEYALNGSGVTTQRNASPANGSIRGNQTSTHHWLDGSTVSTPNCPIAVSNGLITSYSTYNDTGTTNQATDMCGNQAGDPNHSTTFAYSSSLAGAYPTSVTNALGQTTSTNYDFNTGEVTSVTDANNQTTSTSYDSQWRPLQVIRPDKGQTNFCYTDTGGPTCSQTGPPFAVVVTRKIDSTRNMVLTALIDGLGRKTETQLNSDPVCAAPGSRVDTTYDALGRVATVTNPFCTTNDPTYGATTTLYDALARPTQVTHPDGSSATSSYTGRAVQSNDEGNGTNRVQRISQYDGLGRLVNVCEVSSTTLPFGNGAAPAACNLDISATGFLTTYGHDTLGNLKSVSQGGYLARSSTYDSLSQLLTAQNPESGTITYAYDAAGNVITRTDARGIITTYRYDVLHRLTGKSYGDGTPTVTFVYDTCPASGCPSGVTPQLTVGRMVESAVPNAQTFYSYDPMGRAANQWQCTPGHCGTSFYALGYNYDLNGDLISSSNGFGTTLTSAYDTAARLTGVASNLSDAAHPANLLSNIQYNAPGLPRLETLGNNVTQALIYDTRLRLASLTATSPTAVGATPGTATVTINGSEGSQQVAATTAAGSVAIGGSDKTINKQVCHYRNGVPICVQVSSLDTGTVSITIGTNPPATYSYGQNAVVDTPYTVANGLAGLLNGSLVNATVTGDANGLTTCGICTINLTSNGTGTAANYALSTSTFSSAANGASLSFTATASGANLTGGANAYTIYDAGTVSVTINNVPTPVPYGNGSNTNSIAFALASALNAGTLVNATANGNVISITSKNTGSASNYSLSAGSSSSVGFSPVSFTGSASGGALTGGAGATSGPVYIVGLGYAPNSNVLTVNDSVNGNWVYGYDDFNRLVSSNKNSGQQTYSYLYDRFANRWQQNAPLGGNQFQATFTGGNNRLDGVSHDASGNVTKDPVTGNSYAFDAESRVTQVNGGAGNAGGITYIYDADGLRVEKNVGGVTTDYVYDPGGHAIAEINGSGTVTRQELFVAGKHLGTYTNNTTYFSHGDGLGTERVRSDMTGAACETIQSLPYGDGQTTSGSCGDPSTRHFTGKERDSETGLDYFGARYYSNGLGRWISADWSATPVPVPYADLTDPQTLNLYGYVRGLPTTRADVDGHCGPLCGAAIGAVVGGGISVGVQWYKGGFKNISWKKVGVAAAGGALIGATGGAASAAGLPLILQGVAVGSAGVVAGIADRTAETGSLNKATENPKEIAADFAITGATHVTGEVVKDVVKGMSAAGQKHKVVTEALADKMKAKNPHAPTIKRLSQAAAKHEETLGRVEAGADAASHAVRDAAVRTANTDDRRDQK
jgi:RHS repeat-associated protein